MGKRKSSPRLTTTPSFLVLSLLLFPFPFDLYVKNGKHLPKETMRMIMKTLPSGDDDQIMLP
ncbi:hypothetical protein [Bacillus smithii]|jgi:hypothetical protein|uniref:hypothetical protein n=1 Tax=Bacillus smithii TaxID=1479 RepID=UPI002E1B4F90|nr:hypothetical protein [Bacillus smithii]